MRECPECGRLFAETETVCPEDGRALALPGESDPYIGQVVGSYTIVRQIGRGGMGQVYLARHPGIGSQVAIKILDERFAGHPDIAERFFNEARAVNLIGHENIVQIFDFGRFASGTPYFVMEWLNGRPLSAETGQPMPFARASSIARQIAEALQAAHEHGVVHRDLKPDNVFLVPRSAGTQVKVLDFGIAKLTTNASGPTREGMVLGTASYLSPEQASGDAARVTAASDVYALGVILYQLAAGRLPFEEQSFADAVAAHVNRPPPPLPDSVAPGYTAVILRCLRKSPAERYATMAELRDAIVALDAPPRRRVRWVVAAAAALGVAGMGGWAALHRAPSPVSGEMAPSLTTANPMVPSPPPPVAPAPIAGTAATPSSAPPEPARVDPPKPRPKPVAKHAGPVIPAELHDSMIDVHVEEVKLRSEQLRP